MILKNHFLLNSLKFKIIKLIFSIMKGVTTNGAKRASSIIDKLKFKTIYKNKDIHLIPETDKYDGCLIWLHVLLDNAEDYISIFEEKRLLGVNIFYLSYF